MTTQAVPLGLRLFMEGVEVPCIAAQVSIQPSAPAAASIQIIPTDSALLFFPRTLVHLFSLDEDLTDADRRRLDKVNRVSLDRFDVEDERYRLLFSGEVVGYNYSKNPSSRGMVLQCMDLSSYWDTCYQWFADYSVGGSGFTDRTHQFVGAGQGLFDNIASGTKWVTGNILSSAPENPAYKGVKGLLGGFIHLLESIGGVRPNAKGDYVGIRGVNDFFTIAELRYNLSGMVGAIEADTTSAKMFASHAFRDWLRSGMTSSGSLVSYRDVVKLVGQYIFHDVYPNPAAYFSEGREEKKKFFATTVTETTLGKDIVDRLQKASALITSVSTRFGTLGSAGEHRIPVTESIGSLTNASEELSNVLDLLTGTDSADGPRASTAIREARRRVSSVHQDILGSARIDTIAKEVVGSLAVFGDQVKVLDGASLAISTVLKAKTSRRFVKETTVLMGDHLFNQLILPETFFATPPRCNVIFPDQVTNFSYTRNYLREVTRLSCQGGLGIIGMGSRGSGILGRYYVAPNVRDVRGQLLRQSVFSAANTLLPHELHSGIIPKFEWVTDGHRWGIKAAKASGKDAIGKRIAYVQRLANYQFFLHRWSARTMGCTMRFNPYVVLGFPGLVIDRSMPSAAALQLVGETLGDGSSIFPTAYLGKVASISHDINQNGGSTAVSFTHCRTHRSIDDEFLGVLQSDGADNLETATSKTVTVNIGDMISSNKNFGDLENRLFEKFLAGNLVPGFKIDGLTLKSVEEVPLKDDLREDEGNSQLLSRAVYQALGGNDVLFDSYLQRRPNSPQLTTVAPDSTDVIILPRLLVVVFSKISRPGKYIPKQDYVPAEIALRPGWYDPKVWSNETLSAKVYQPLLGARAITDDAAMSDPAQFKDLVNEMFKLIGVGPSVNLTPNDDGSLKLVIGDVPITTFNAFYKVDPITGELVSSTAEQAIDGLTMLYGLIKQRGHGSQAFIRDYIKRPIATLPQILGSAGATLNGGELEDPSMVEGFHTRAYGDYNTDVRFRYSTQDGLSKPEAGEGAMNNLLPASAAGRKAFNASGTVVNRKVKLKNIPDYLDPRGAARRRVLSYAKELQLSRGLMAT